MINLTRKAAKRFNRRWAELPEQQGDCWKVDVIMVSRYPVLLIIHEYTLYTLVRRKAELPAIQSVMDEISRCCPWYEPQGALTVGKNLDKRLNGSINEMKRVTAGDYSENFAREIQEGINTCPFSALSNRKYDYGTPMEALELYKKGLWPQQDVAGTGEKSGE